MKSNLKMNSLLAAVLTAIILSFGSAASVFAAGETRTSPVADDSLMRAFQKTRAEEGDQNAARYSQQTKISAADAANDDDFGVDVDLLGDTAIIGSNQDDIGTNADQGSAYVFVRTGATWTLQQKLTASDGAAGDNFGCNVAIANQSAPSQTVIMVGAYGNDANGVANKGAVYVFVRASGGTSWSQQGKLTASDGTTDDVFGSSVALTGGYAIIGAHGDNSGSVVDAGSAYIFIRNGSVWEESQKLTPSIPATTGNFGWSVDISGTYAVVGNNYQGSLAGNIEIFEKVSSGNTWNNVQRITGGGHFGSSVAINGTTIVAGSPFTSAAFTEDGVATVITRNGSGTWATQMFLYAPDAASGDNFGKSVDVSGDTIIVGADRKNLGGSNYQGAAYIFTRSGTSWTFQQKLLDSTGAIDDRFGNSVAISGDTLIVGAYLDDLGTIGQGGSASIFTISNGAQFDFDGDGKSDVSVFRPSSGAWYIQQSANGFTGISFGASTDKIVPADYDGDGKTDVAVYRGGTWYLQRSSLGFTGVAFGASTDIPVPADFDGDGKAELCVFRPSNGGWYQYNLATNQTNSFAFGQNGDVPVPADYDADGKADIAVFRASTGAWYLQRSSLGFTGITFGQTGDKPVPADYDGDGKTDVAVFRAGTWYLQRSALGFTGISFGLGTDIPTPGDYDGDGKADVAVFRPSTGAWYLQRSTAGFTGVTFGANGDVAVPSAYVP